MSGDYSPHQTLCSVGFSWSFNQQTTTTHHPIPPLSNIPTKTNKAGLPQIKECRVARHPRSMLGSRQSAQSTSLEIINTRFVSSSLLSPSHQSRERTNSGLNIILHVIPS